MAAFRELREALLFAYQDGSIDDTEFALLYDLNSSENLEFPYWKYGRFDLDSMTDDKCKQGHPTAIFGKISVRKTI